MGEIPRALKEGLNPRSRFYCRIETSMTKLEEIEKDWNSQTYMEEFDSDHVDWLIDRVKVLTEALELAGGQLGNPNIGDACANACKTIAKALNATGDRPDEK